MKLLGLIKDIEKNSVFLDYVLCKSNKNKLYLLDKEKSFVLNNVYDYDIFNETIFYQENNLESLYLLNLYTENEITINGVFSLRGAFHINEDNIYILGKENTLKVIYIFDTKTHLLKSVVNTDYFPKLSIKDLCFCVKKNTIYCFDSLLNENIWSYTCPEGRKIEGNLYAYQEVLAFIEGDEEGETTLVGLDIHSGEILYKEVVGLIHYQQQGNKLYGFASTTFGDNTYSEIDILKGEVYEKSFPNYKRDTVSHLATIKEDYLYYSIYKDGGIGIIDTKKKEIIKEEFLDIEDGVQIEAPVVTEDKIYILDSEQVLHIYQREM
ncbi:hypothetical protein HMPREF9699_01461 [Bergeyella zoohelcum ATCC 43767]|uniref:Uncharacterized protein n=1 Tax=Bergeyella zoohelcum ATCC 43767 TaxID=883096 RepID=K1LXE4_9FLAO|nr:hypothetical protein [Bergeyella zoohelcum]EKB56732.1 hypothetical protein HMPREF9699_01461 [Bergeyella zoohelcum ATCC 43767]